MTFRTLPEASELPRALYTAEQVRNRDVLFPFRPDSDFFYLDVSATAEIPIWRGLALQALINLTPERHREPDDNSVTNYTSVDLLYRF